MPSLHRLARVLGVSPDRILADRLHLGPIALVRGHVHAGSATAAEGYDDTIPIPSSIKEEHPSAFALVVAGDSLADDGVSDGDILLVDPKAPVDHGSICVVQVGNDYIAGHYFEIGDGRGRVRNRDGLDAEVPGGEFQLIGKVVWHIRRM